MARFYTYMIMIVGIMALLNVFGIITSGTYVLGQLGMDNAEALADFKGTSYYVGLIATLLLIGGAGGIIIGTFSSQSYETAISGSLALLVMVLFLGDMLEVAKLVSSSGDWAWVSWIIYLIMLPLLFGFAVSMYDWVRRHD